jgi:hypothetical protein
VQPDRPRRATRPKILDGLMAEVGYNRVLKRLQSRKRFRVRLKAFDRNIGRVSGLFYGLALRFGGDAGLSFTREYVASARPIEGVACFVGCCQNLLGDIKTTTPSDKLTIKGDERQAWYCVAHAAGAPID